MKILRMFLFLSVCGLIGWGWLLSRQLANLNHERESLLHECVSLKNPSGSTALTPSTKHANRQQAKSDNSRIDQSKRLLFGYKKMTDARESGQAADPALFKELAEIQRDMVNWNTEELQLLIRQIDGDQDLDERAALSLFSSAISRLSDLDPKRALEILSQRPQPKDPTIAIVSEPLMSGAFSKWAGLEPLQALEWYQQKESSMSDMAKSRACASLVAGAASQNVNLAIQVADKLGMKNYWSTIAHKMNTPEQVSSYLDAVRQKAKETQSTDSQALDQGLGPLFNYFSYKGYDQAISLLEGGKLSANEIESCITSINYYDVKNDTQKWLSWILKSTIGQEPAKTSIQKILREWTNNDYMAAGKWLNDAPAGSMKEAAVVSYVDAVAPYNSEVAVQWADTLPADKKGKAMKDIFDQLKGRDSQAAEAFAQKYQLGEGK